MIRHTGIQTVLAVFITLSAPAVAEPRETVEQWVDEALANNATLGALQSTIEAAEAEVGHLGRPCCQVWPGSRNPGGPEHGRAPV